MKRVPRSTRAWRCLCLGVLWVTAWAGAAHAAGSLLAPAGAPGAFPLVSGDAVAPVVIDRADAAVVGIAARDLVADIERVTGFRGAVIEDGSSAAAFRVLVGTLGRSAPIDALVRAGKLDTSRLAGQWETFLISVIEDPVPGVDRALVIAGSDRRGTAFGVYELSQQIGISPWHWWSDVPPRRSASLHLRGGTQLFGPPSVK